MCPVFCCQMSTVVLVSIASLGPAHTCTHLYTPVDQLCFHGVLALPCHPSYMHESSSVSGPSSSKVALALRGSFLPQIALWKGYQACIIPCHMACR